MFCFVGRGRTLIALICRGERELSKGNNNIDKIIIIISILIEKEGINNMN